MKKLIVILIVSISFLNSCKENRNKVVNKNESVILKTNGMKENPPSSIVNTKWIIGEVGLNGEIPDTLFFYDTNKLLYISSENGKEECKYFFNNDTLVFIDSSLEYDYISDSEVKAINTNKLLLTSNKLKYIETTKEVNGKKSILSLEKENLFFSKIK